MDEDSEEAWALTAYARAVLADEHGGTAEDRAAATAALARPKVATALPGVVLVATALAAEGPARDAARKAVLESNLDGTEVHEAAGRLLLAKGDVKGAVLHFKRALELNPGNVRALVALGDYYREAGDDAAALTAYSTAEAVSPDHPQRVLGEVESRLALEQDLPGALAELDKLSPDPLTPELKIRRAARPGPACSPPPEPTPRRWRCSPRERRVPASGPSTSRWRSATRSGRAVTWARRRRRWRPRSSSGRRARRPRRRWAGCCSARDREKELLQRFATDEGRRLALLRGIAWVRLKDTKKARAELAKTAVAGKFPVEAVAWFALADAADGEVDKAQTVLEKTLGASKRPRSDVAVALGKVYWQRGMLDRARAQFEGASKDPRDYEGACALGRLLWVSGSPERAVEPLTLSVQHNQSHGESRHALSRVYVALAKPAEALAQAEAWAAENPSSATAQKDAALALLQSGKWKEAEAALGPGAEARRPTTPSRTGSGRPCSSPRATAGAASPSSSGPMPSRRRTARCSAPSAGPSSGRATSRRARRRTRRRSARTRPRSVAGRRGAAQASRGEDAAQRSCRGSPPRPPRDRPGPGGGGRLAGGAGRRPGSGRQARRGSGGGAAAISLRRRRWPRAWCSAA